VIPGRRITSRAAFPYGLCMELGRRQPSVSADIFRLRTIREGVNSLLPVAQIGVKLCVRLMSQLGTASHRPVQEQFWTHPQLGCNWFSSFNRRACRR
jgi:hypothetical protein